MKFCPSCNEEHDRREPWCSVDCKTVVDSLASIEDNLRRIQAKQNKKTRSPHRTDMEIERDGLVEDVATLTAEVDRLETEIERFQLMAVQKGWNLDDDEKRVS